MSKYGFDLDGTLDVPVIRILANGRVVFDTPLMIFMTQVMEYILSPADLAIRENGHSQNEKRNLTDLESNIPKSSVV
jgi:hypothetical protein